MSRLFGDWQPGSKHGGGSGLPGAPSVRERIQITNLPEIQQLLDSIPVAYQARVQYAMLKKAAKPTLDKARGNAPVAKKDHLYAFRGKRWWVQKGNLKRSIGFIDVRRARFVTVIIGPRVKGAFKNNRSGFYGSFMEYGTKTIKQLQPFMWPAYHDTKGQVMNIYQREAKAVFDKAFNKLKAKGKI